MTKFKNFLPFEIYWDDLDIDGPGLAIQITNSLESRTKLKVYWRCRLGDHKPPKIEDGVMKIEPVDGDCVEWDEEDIDWVDPNASKHFFCDLECVHKMVQASEVLSSDLVRLQVLIDGEEYEIFSGAELHEWLEKNVPDEHRPLPIYED